MQTKKILVAAINARFSHTSLASYYQARYVEKYPQYTFEIVEYTINASYEKMILALSCRCPDVVMVSVYIWNVHIVRRLAADLPVLLPGTLLVLGGPEVRYGYETWPSTRQVLPVSGSEASLLALLESGFSVDRYHETGQTIPLSGIPFPYSDDDLVRLRDRYLYYESSRGCIRRCSYCLSSADACSMDYRSLDMVLDELSVFMDARVRMVKFVDRTFNADPDRARLIWRHILDCGSETVFHFEIDGALLSQEDITLLRSVPSGMFHFEIGVQSTNPDTLAEIGRSRNIVPVLDAVRELRRNTQLHLHADLIAGLPYEGLTEYARSFDAVMSLGAHHVQPGFLKVLPGTEMRRKADEYGMSYSSTAPYHILATRWLPPEDLMLLLHIEELVESIHNRHILCTAMRMLANRCGGHFDAYRRFSQYCTVSGRDHTQKRIESIAHALHDFAVSSIPDPHAVTDALVYDLLSATRARAVPAFAAALYSDKETGHFLGRAEAEGWPFTRRQHAGRSVVFRPQSRAFYDYAGYPAGTLFCFINGTADAGGRYGDYEVIIR
ncbi:MAG: DUF4080 domain-containing protein [Spirochaetota bacterium]